MRFKLSQESETGQAEMGQAEHHRSQAGVLHASHGRAEHLPVGVELCQESEMGQAERHNSQAGALHGRGRAEHLHTGVKLSQEIEMGQAEQKPEGKQEQRCRDDTICSSSMITQSVRQSPTTQGAVARYVGVPIGNYIVPNLTNTNPGTTGDETIVRAEQEHNQEIEMGWDEHQQSQAGVLHAGHGRAEHLPIGVKLSQEIEMGQAEHQHSQAGAFHEQRCSDDTSCSSSMVTQNVRQSPTIPGAVARYVGLPVGNYCVTNLTTTNLGPTGDERIVRAEQGPSQMGEKDQAEHLPTGTVRVEQDQAMFSTSPTGKFGTGISTSSTGKSKTGVFTSSTGISETRAECVELNHEIEMGRADHQQSQAGVLHTSHGQAEHLHAAKVRVEQEQDDQQCGGECVELSHDIEMGQAERNQSQAGAIHVSCGQAEHLPAEKVGADQGQPRKKLRNVIQATQF